LMIGIIMSVFVMFFSDINIIEFDVRFYNLFL
jgi:hypothetical protein